MKGLVLVYAMLALGTLGAIWKPRYGLFVYIAFATLRPQFLWGFAGGMEGLSLWVGVAMIAAWAMHGAGSWQFGRGKLAVVALVFYTVWSILSAMQADYPDVSWAFVVNLLKIVLPFLVGVTLLKGEDDARIVLWIIVACQGWVSYEMNTSYFNGYNRAAEQGFGGMDNNCFGISLVTTLGPAMALTLSEKRWVLKGIAGVATALILHTTMLTFSRGAMLGIVAVFVTAGIVMPKSPKYLAGVFLAMLLAIRLTGPELLSRYESAFAGAEDRDASAESRLDLWADCLAVAFTRPIFGIGPDNWPKIAANYGYTQGKSAHSAWMQSVAEVGFAGVLALLLFFCSAAARLWPIARGKLDTGGPATRLLATGIITSIVGFVVSAQFVTLQGLEIPYYVAIGSVALLKDERLRVPKAPSTEPVLPPRGFRHLRPAIR